MSCAINMYVFSALDKDFNPSIIHMSNTFIYISEIVMRVRAWFKAFELYFFIAVWICKLRFGIAGAEKFWIRNMGKNKVSIKEKTDRKPTWMIKHKKHKT